MMNEGCTNVVPTMPLVSQGSNGYGNGGFGDGAWFWIIVIFALLFGWGGYGGFGGGFGGGNGGGVGYDLGRLATTHDVSNGFALNKIDNQLNGITSGICDSTYAITQAINGLGTQMAGCCCDTQKEIIENRYTNQLATQALQAQLASCCCDIEKSISDQNFLNAQNTNAIIQSQNEGTRAILDKMCQTEIQNLRDQNQAYAIQLSQQAQTANLLEKLIPVSKPAYITCSPFQSAMYPFGFGGYGYGNGCGSCNQPCGC